VGQNRLTTIVSTCQVFIQNEFKVLVLTQDKQGLKDISNSLRKAGIQFYNPLNAKVGGV